MYKLTLSQHGKAFGLSATPIAYLPLVLIPYFIAIADRLKSLLYT